MNIVLDQLEITKAISIYTALRGLDTRGDYKFQIVNGTIQVIIPSKPMPDDWTVESIINNARSEEINAELKSKF